MDVMGWNVEPQRLEGTLSLTHLRAKLFPVDKLDRAPVSSEDKYTPKTLVGNWFERRAVHTPELVQWKTTYDVDYIPHVNKSWKENQLIKWDNILDLEGLPREVLLDHREEYYNNMTTTYDLCYNILPKSLDTPRFRFYNARQRKWIPEQDLTKSYGSLTQFGLKAALEQETSKNSEEGIAKCRWWTTYNEEIGKLTPGYVERRPKFARRAADFNVPDLTHFERKSADIERCLLPLKIRKEELKRSFSDSL